MQSSKRARGQQELIVSTLSWTALTVLAVSLAFSGNVWLVFSACAAIAVLIAMTLRRSK